ncbi:MAG: LPXTG cell wall anchor domain-containing protein [Actinomycetota bacterium]|nr:LPXTG cell wall anchor domain-containing protein [Actinomycetota bacterium]
MLPSMSALFSVIAQHLPPSPSPGATVQPSAGPGNEAVWYVAVAIAVLVGAGLLLLLRGRRRRRPTP